MLYSLTKNIGRLGSYSFLGKETNLIYYKKQGRAQSTRWLYNEQLKNMDHVLLRCEFTRFVWSCFFFFKLLGQVCSS